MQRILIDVEETNAVWKKKILARMPVVFGIRDTRFGKALLGVCERGVCHLSFLNTDAPTRLAEFKRVWTNPENRRDDGALRKTFEMIFKPDEQNNPLKIFLLGTRFQLDVWKKLLAIESGRTLSYSKLAKLVGKPKSVRAVANAVGANEISYIVPCHRIIGKTGKLCGYRWGVDVKTAILKREGVSFESD